MTVFDLINENKDISVIDSKTILSYLLNCNFDNLVDYYDTKISTDFVDTFLKFVDKVKSGYPVQYLVGNVCFCGYNFKITEGVLIPRFETEELVDRVSLFISEHFNDKYKLIDLGCGSGVIGLTLKKKHPMLDVTCLDISLKALELSKFNSSSLLLDVNFIQNDMLNGINDCFDIIVSNPPYIAYDEVIDDKVYKYEPHDALFALDEGIYFYKSILKDAVRCVNKRFLIAFEIGYLQADRVKELAKEYFPLAKCEVYKDLSLRDRMVFIYNI